MVFGVGVGLDAFVVSATVDGEIKGEADAFFAADQFGRIRLSDFMSGCVFDPLEGEITAGVVIHLSVGFSPFKLTHTIPLAETTLVDFSLGCAGSGMGIESDQGFALAAQTATAAVNAPDDPNGAILQLNVGARSDHRSIGGVVGDPNSTKPEIFKVTLGTHTDDDGNVTNIPDTLGVWAYGINEVYGSTDHKIGTIVASFGVGDDALIINSAVTQASDIHGNEGDDVLLGGGGNDILHGDAGNDYLRAGAGDNQLFGGTGNDTLAAGEGRDLLDGGDGTAASDGNNSDGSPQIDQVTYENSTAGVSFTPTKIDGRFAFVGSGGWAEGDKLISIEYLIGSPFRDTLYANPTQDTTLEGLGGNDTLLGGTGKDFLIGGPGADYLNGSVAGTIQNGNFVPSVEEDGTTYASSLGAVQIDLAAHTATGGDAQGDVLISIEDVQGTAYGDLLLGDNSRNVLDGWFGDDIIDGRLGADVIGAGAGDDTVFGRASGATLDGGDGFGDLLTYERASAAVTVNLKTGDGRLTGSSTHDTITPYVVVAPDGTAHSVAGFSSFENLTGSAFFDSLTGDDFDNIIKGLAGNDTIHGGAGDDTLIGGVGADTMDGGDGIDLADYSSSLFGVSVDLFHGTGASGDAAGDVLVLKSTGANTTFNTIENLLGSLQPDTLIGDDGTNVIDPNLSHSRLNSGFIDLVDGGAGIDTLKLDYSQEDLGKGMAGGFDIGATSTDWKTTGTFTRQMLSTSDVRDGVTFSNIERLEVIGTIKNDLVRAGQGDDTIATGGGDDTVYAGLGNDRVYSGSGNDFVALGTGADLKLSASGGLYRLDVDGGAGHRHPVGLVRRVTLRHRHQRPQHDIVLHRAESLAAGRDGNPQFRDPEGHIDRQGRRPHRAARAIR